MSVCAAKAYGQHTIVMHLHVGRHVPNRSGRKPTAYHCDSPFGFRQLSFGISQNSPCQTCHAERSEASRHAVIDIPRPAGVCSSVVPSADAIYGGSRWPGDQQLPSHSTCWSRSSVAMCCSSSASTSPATPPARPLNNQLFLTLRDSSNALEQQVAIRALFLIALRDSEQAQHIRVALETDTYKDSPRPITRLWSNKLLVMLDLADLVHPAQPFSDEQRAQVRRQLEADASTYSNPKL
jgi:hypothetical protein